MGLMQDVLSEHVNMGANLGSAFPHHNVNNVNNMIEKLEEQW